MSEYAVEARYPDWVQGDGWITIQTDRLEYCRGYLAALLERTPRPAYRLRRVKDGRIMKEHPAVLEASIGMIAGWPTGQQQIATAARLQRGYVSAEEVATAEAALRILEPTGALVTP